MVKFIHHILGTPFYVDGSRVEEYKAAGHKPAADSKRKSPKKPKTEKEEK